jgi:hypothetical protein
MTLKKRRVVVDVGTARDRERRELLTAWRRLVNMSGEEIAAFLSDFGDVAGMSRADAASAGIKSGRDNARALLRMLDKAGAGRAREVTYEAASRAWTPAEWRWAQRQAAYLRRALGQARAVEERAGSPWYTDRGRPTRLLLAVNLWGRKPGSRIARPKK